MFLFIEQFLMISSINNIQNYVSLTKPRMILGNLITAVAGFLLGSGGAVDLPRGALMLLGLAFIIASACAFNNVIDRDIDAKMERTKSRALVMGSISLRYAILFGAALGLCGIFILDFFVNLLAASSALFGLFAYVALYSFWGKRRSVYGTWVGSISGAMPPVVGYSAASGRLDAGAFILFLILVLWQMPHFYAIAIRRLPEYAAANIPVLPAVRGIRRAKISILLYIAAFIAATTLLKIFGYLGWTYLLIAIALGAWWLYAGIRGWRVADDAQWARDMFLRSLFVLLAFSILIAASATLRLP